MSAQTRDEPALRPALDAEWRMLETRAAGGVGCYADDSGPGEPLVLVHSLNAAPSAAEMKPLFERYRGVRPVLAIDLPGFGRSQRGDRPYTPELLAAAVDEACEATFSSPADVIALSLGAEIAARAILGAPARWRSLCMISPTGFSKRQPPGPRVSSAIEGLIAGPLVAEPLFRLLTSPRSIRFFLARNFEGPPSEEMIRHAIATARQPGACHAPLRFLSGRLFTRDALEILYDRLRLPVLVLYDRDPNVSFERLPDWLARDARREARRIAPTRGLPHWERLDACADALDDFWLRHASPGEPD